ncbi:MAG: TIGR03013 family PEP-CTERM/XrtA system glycosyltransferase [Deltaproteobacteria bacterium]|nr:TIGR03013 family PEP-CTERM/XrtA system glycosyltransferase [Deltaproteobacteria bacterium]
MNRNSLLLVSGDFLGAWMAYGLAAFIQVGIPFSLGKMPFDAWTNLIIFVLVLLLTTYFLELYNLEKAFHLWEIVFRLAVSLLLAFLTLSALYYLFPQVTTGRRLLILALAAFGFLQLLWHKTYQAVLQMPGFAKRVLIFGAGPMAVEIREVLTEKAPDAVFVGYVKPEGDAVTVPEGEIVEAFGSLVATAKKERVKKIIVALTERRKMLPVRDLLRCKFAGIDVVENTTFYEEITGKLMLERTNPSWFLFSNSFKVTPFTLFTRFNKRIFDVTFALVGLVFALPFMPFIALAVKLSSPGPVFFCQVRLGKDEKPFLLCKFRTMREDAEKLTGAVYAQQNDPRVTAVGRFLRKSRLDELPQLFNVLVGDMSFVGPRPERPEFVEKLNQKFSFYSKRHSVKPGITGWAQVRYPYGASDEDSNEKLKYDLYYIKNYSLKLDFYIVLETIKVVLFGRGGR